MGNREATCELASLLAEVIRRMGASYGPPKEWRRDFTRAVKVFEGTFNPLTKTPPEQLGE